MPSSRQKLMLALFFYRVIETQYLTKQCTYFLRIYSYFSPQQDHHDCHEWRTLGLIYCSWDPHNLPQET